MIDAGLALVLGFAFVLGIFSIMQPVDTSSIVSSSNLSGNYTVNGQTAINNLIQTLFNATDPNTGQPLTNFQINLILVQDILETGLWQGDALTNWNAINILNNYGGLMGNSFYPSGTGTVLAQYPTIQAGVTDQLRVLNNDFGAGQPLYATSVIDFITKLRGTKPSPGCGYICDVDVINYNRNFQNIYNSLFS